MLDLRIEQRQRSKVEPTAPPRPKTDGDANRLNGVLDVEARVHKEVKAQPGDASVGRESAPRPAVNLIRGRVEVRQLDGADPWSGPPWGRDRQPEGHLRVWPRSIHQPRVEPGLQRIIPTREPFAGDGHRLWVMGQQERLEPLLASSLNLPLVEGAEREHRLDGRLRRLLLEARRQLLVTSAPGLLVAHWQA